MESFPSEPSLEIPSTLKGKGTLVIDKSGKEKDVRGSLDLTLIPTGLRMFAAARISHATDDSGNEATAAIASAVVEFPTMIPIASSGLGLKGLEGLYATHFQRVEDPPDPPVPAALKWLKQVDGNVVESVTAYPKRWKIAWDKSAFGLGVLLGLQNDGKLVNLNALLVLEQPGPRILVFAKANFLKDPKGNKEKETKENLDTGILGLLEINVPRKEITFAALADLRFEKYISFTAPIEVFFALMNLSSWHLYFGTFDNKVRATLEIANIFSLGVAAYFMAAGDCIRNAPVPGGRQDLPGFALALGAEAYVKIGEGILYLRIDFRCYLFVSFGEALYVTGGVSISGELHLFFVSIGASGDFSFEFLQPKAGATKEPGRVIYIPSVRFRMIGLQAL
jgi:hypothetical protein